MTALDLTADDGHVLAAYRAEPEGPPRGAIVVIQEIFGVNEHIRAVADDFAQQGYIAIAPALFDRVQRGVELGYTPDDVTAGRELRSKVVLFDAMRDVNAAIANVAHAGKIGIVGYCWGGFVVWMASAAVPQLACAVIYYGGGIVESPEVSPRCPVLGHFGNHDKMIPVDKVNELAGKHHHDQFFLYDADHGFNCDKRGSYNADAATLARERTFAFFRKHVG